MARFHTSLAQYERAHPIAVGDEVVVKLAEAVPVTGGLTLELVEHDGKGVANAGRGRRGGPPPRRKAGQAKAAAGKKKLRKRR
jgi:ribonuclease R